MNAYHWGIGLILLGLVLTLTWGLTFTPGNPWLLIGPVVAIIGLVISTSYLLFGEQVHPRAPRMFQRRRGRGM